MLDAFALLVMFGTGFAAGMYVTSQIGDWIDKRISNNKKK